jgi:8-oxo-dGTP diphosphatase
MSVEQSGPRLGSAVLVTSGDSVLLGVRAKEPNRGKWVLPGGKIEPFESIEDAARREVREETGLDVRITGQLGAYEIINPPDEHRLIVFSRAEPLNGELMPGSDLSEVRFCDRRALPSLILSDLVRTVLADAGWLDSEQEVAA